MKEFNQEKFCEDLVALRGEKSQKEFAKEFGIKRSTLSLLENGKQIPNITILGQLCKLAQKSVDEYFVDSTKDALVYLMGSLKEEDKVEVKKMAERIQIKEKYELLAKRNHYIDY